MRRATVDGLPAAFASFEPVAVARFVRCGTDALPAEAMPSTAAGSTARDSQARYERWRIDRDEDHVDVRRVNHRYLPEVELAGTGAAKVVERLDEADRLDRLGDDLGV